jgi:hypothetical protein
MDSFVGFVVILIVWLVAGSIGASLLTKKGYLAPESANRTLPGYTHRTTSSGVPMQYFVAFFGPVALVAGLALPERHGGSHA